MGAASTKHLPELEEAQHQVRRLTAEKLKMSQMLQVKISSLGAAEAEVANLRQRSERLSKVESELNSMSTALLKAKREASQLPSVAVEIQERAKRTEQELLKTRAELEASKDELLGLTKTRAELEASRDELLSVFGKLKLEAQEQRELAQKTARLAETEAQLAKEREVERESALLVAQANAALVGAEDSEVHPVFGNLLADLGHKRLYRADPRTLWSKTLLWDEQRVFRKDRAELIALSKMKSVVEGWPGAISVVEVEEQDSEGMRKGAVVDGQHRLGAANVLANKGKLSAVLQHMLVEVYPPMESKDIRSLFVEINKAEPVKLVDLPVLGASAEENKILTEAAEELKSRYGAMFKPSQSCRPPHLNVDNLRNDMHQAQLLEMHKLSCAAELVEWLETKNASLATREAKAWKAGRIGSTKSLTNALAKAHANKFYLGLGSDWLQPPPPTPTADK